MSGPQCNDGPDSPPLAHDHGLPSPTDSPREIVDPEADSPAPVRGTRTAVEADSPSLVRGMGSSAAATGSTVATSTISTRVTRSQRGITKPLVPKDGMVRYDKNFRFANFASSGEPHNVLEALNMIKIGRML